ncbi:MAG TPA: FIST N-terminal domain-containing protein [Capillibacterium sp.]|mgnify:CR=1 FL=1
MFQMLTGNQSGEDVRSVVAKLIATIRQPQMKLVMFFSSKKYDIKEVAKIFKEYLPDVHVVGCTTAGELSNQGFTEGSISALSIAADDFEAAPYLMKEINRKVLFAKDDIIRVAETIGLSQDSEDGFILTLIDSSQAAEEKILSLLRNNFPKLDIVGGSAADEDFKETLVSVNGETMENAAAIVFVRTSHEMLFHKENIYTPTDIQLEVTKANIQQRLVLELNGKPAAEEYARILGIDVGYLRENFRDVFFSNPLGRTFGEDIWITAPTSIVDDKAIAFASLILPGTRVKLLKPVDAVAEAVKTVETIKQKLPNCKGAILFNCLLRYLQFKQDNQTEIIAREYAKLGPICGFNTHGEQLQRHHMNQTLTLVAFGD